MNILSVTLAKENKKIKSDLNVYQNTNDKNLKHVS